MAAPGTEDEMLAAGSSRDGRGRQRTVGGRYLEGKCSETVVGSLSGRGQRSHAAPSIGGCGDGEELDCDGGGAPLSHFL
jgi:hypothetical protein